MVVAFLLNLFFGGMHGDLLYGNSIAKLGWL